MTISKATAQWDGTLKAGKGVMRPAHAGVIGFTLGSRFEGKPGSNPEEILGAALAGCFSMALSLALEQAGTAPKSIHTSADVHMASDNGAFVIDTIDLVTEVDAPGMDARKLEEIGKETKKRCPVGRALGGVGSINLTTKLK